MVWEYIIAEAGKALGGNEAFSGSEGYFNNYDWMGEGYLDSIKGGFSDSSFSDIFKNVNDRAFITSLFDPTGTSAVVSTLDPSAYSGGLNSGDYKNLLTGGWAGALSGAKAAREAKRQERREESINYAYKTVFGRDPTAEELELFNTGIINKEYNNPQDLIDALRNSPEYQAAVKTKYNEMVGGAGSGLENFTNYLQEQDYSSVIPKYIQSSLGTYGRTKDNVLMFQESPELKAKRGADLDAYLQTLSTIGRTGEERAAQINQTSNAYMNQLLRTSLPQLEQALIGRGLRGSNIYGQQVGNLIFQSAESAALNRESLFAQNEQLKQSQLGLLQSGLSQDYATLLDAQRLGESALASRENIAQNYYSSNLALQQASIQAASAAEQRAHEFALSFLQQEEAKQDAKTAEKYK